MWDKPLLPLLLQLGALIGTALYLFFVRSYAPIAISYGIVTPSIILGVGLFAWIHPRADARWYARALWITFPMILVNIPGTLVLHSLPLQYDRFLHFGIGFLVLLLVFRLASIWKHPLMLALIYTLVGLVVFEGYQWSSDRILGTKMFSDTTQAITRDVAEDIAFGFFGVLLATAWIRREFR